MSERKQRVCAPLVQTVTCCGDCPLQHTDARDDSRWCVHPRAPEDYSFRRQVDRDIGLDSTAHLPKRCPLRRHGVMVTTGGTT